MSLLDQMPHTVSHYRQKYIRDEYMASIPEQVALESDVRAWVQNASQTEITEFQKRDQLITHKVYYTGDPGIRPGDQIVVTAGPSFIGRTFDFQSQVDRSAGLGVLWGCMVSETNNVPKTFDED